MMSAAARVRTPPRRIYSNDGLGRPESAQTDDVLNKAVELLEDSGSDGGAAGPTGMEAGEDGVRPSTAADGAYQRWRASLNLHLGIGRSVALPPLPRTPHPRSPARTPVLPINGSYGTVAAEHAGSSATILSEEKQSDEVRMDTVAVTNGASEVQGRAAAGSVPEATAVREGEETNRSSNSTRETLPSRPPHLTFQPPSSNNGADPASAPTMSSWELWLQSRCSRLAPPGKARNDGGLADAAKSVGLRVAPLDKATGQPGHRLGSSNIQCDEHLPLHPVLCDHYMPPATEGEHSPKIDRILEDTEEGLEALDEDPEIKKAYDTLFEEARREIALENHGEANRYAVGKASNMGEKITAIVPSPAKQHANVDISTSQDQYILPLKSAYETLEGFRGKREALQDQHLMLMDSPPRLMRWRWNARPSSRDLGEEPPRGRDKTETRKDKMIEDVENLAENIRSWHVPSPKKRARRKNNRSRNQTARVLMPPRDHSGYGLESSALTTKREILRNKKTQRNDDRKARSQQTRRMHKADSDGSDWLAHALQPSRIHGGVLDLSV